MKTEIMMFDMPSLLTCLFTDCKTARGNINSLLMSSALYVQSRPRVGKLCDSRATTGSKI